MNDLEKLLTPQRSLREREMAAILSVLLLLVFFCADSQGTTIQWYRTAQGTNDRLTKQANITFGGDFASNASLIVDRYIGIMYTQQGKGRGGAGFHARTLQTHTNIHTQIH